MADTVTYAVAVRQPEYLPEDTPFYAETLHEAREAAAATVRHALTYADDSSVAGMTAEELDNVLMGAYDVGPDGGHVWMPGDQGYIVIAPVW